MIAQYIWYIIVIAHIHAAHIDAMYMVHMGT